jgi:hypothetical protein
LTGHPTQARWGDGKSRGLATGSAGSCDVGTLA